MKISLYLKTHNKTGLKYLGKTTGDPYTYQGSGTRWVNHLAKHGNDVSTEVLFETSNADELKRQGLYYSELWDIVNSKDFANMRPESGDGGDTSNCEAYKEGIKRRDISGDKNPMAGRSAIVEQDIRWYNNGTENMYVPAGTQPPEYKPGRIIDYKKPHTESTKKKLSQYGNKPCISPDGREFRSRKAAAEAYGVTPEAIGGLIKRGVSGWRWL